MIFLFASCARTEGDAIDKKIDEYLCKMSIEEKVGQLCCPIGFTMYDKVSEDEVVPCEAFKAMMDTLPCGGFWAVLRRRWRRALTAGNRCCCSTRCSGM